jgi:hypothetical protein
MVVNVILVVIGASLVALSARRRGTVEAGSESEPVPALHP